MFYPEAPLWAWLTLPTMKISSACRGKKGAAGQVLAIAWAIFTTLRWQSAFCRADGDSAGQKCHHPPNPEHEVTPLILPETPVALKTRGARQ